MPQRCPPLVMRIAAKRYRGLSIPTVKAACAEPMMHLVPGSANRRPGSPAGQVRRLHPSWHSEAWRFCDCEPTFARALLRALLWALPNHGRFSAPGRFRCLKPSRSCPTIQVLFCLSEMWPRHDGLTTSARATPERSHREAVTRKPAAATIPATASCWPAPSSSTRWPAGASSRDVCAAMIR